MKKRHTYFFVGTTAEFIKLAPIIKTLKKRRIEFKFIASGQNKINFKELEEYVGTIKPDFSFPEKAYKSSILFFLIWAVKTLLYGLIKLRKEFKGLNKENSYFIIHGDTVSSLIGSLIARFYGLKLIQIESGLRSFNFLEPFPEEICRYIISYLADILFPPNDWALNNIERFRVEKINTLQNTLIETCWWALGRKQETNYKKIFGKYYVLIMHRQEHIYFGKEWTRKLLELITKNAPKDINCVFLLHALTSRFLQSESLNLGGERAKTLFFVPRLPYQNFMNLMKNAQFIATDGCTNQEEAYYMGLPLLALRNRTERTEGLESNIVISGGNKKLIKHFLVNYKKFRRKPVHLAALPSKIVVDFLFPKYTRDDNN